MQTQLHYTDHNGTRAPLTISTAQQFLDVALLTDEDISTAVQAISDELTNPDKLDDIILAAVTEYKKAAAGHDYPLIVKLRAVTRFSMLAGYSMAMRDVKAVQAEILKQIQAEARPA